MLRALADRLAARVKRDPSYRVAPDLTDRQLARVLWQRGRQWLRGVPLRAIAPGVRGAVFRGRRVVVEHAAQLSSGPGLVLEDGACLRALSREGIALGRNVTIARGAVLACTGVITELGVGLAIGDRSAVGAGAFLGAQGGLTIGDDVLLGPGVRVFTENHAYDALDVPIRAQGTRRAHVTIEDDCWVGAGVTILAGVRVGRGSVLAAGAVVTRDVPPYSVMAGVPARVLRSRRPSPAPAPALGPVPRPPAGASPHAPGARARRGGR